MHAWTMQHRVDQRSIGLVPTMGALHEGHLSLVQASQRHCDATVVSIFVNPTQFGQGEDLDRYPRTLQQDLELLAAEQVAAVFVPDSEEIYPAGFSTFVQPPAVANSLEGVHRPTHFRGVTTIVAKLFLIAPVTHAFFGRKDYQQWKVIETMARDLNFAIEIVACDIVRQADGLALSSRNRYLGTAARRRALLLNQALDRVVAAVGRGESQPRDLERLMAETLCPGSGAGVDAVDYATVVDAETLAPIERIERPAVALIAAWVDQTRLLDNRLL